MLEEERASLTDTLANTKRNSKKEIQELFGLNVDPDARIFVSLGRLVRQKGVDLLADIAPWLLENFQQAQVIIVGPIGDGFGHYAAQKLQLLTEDGRFKGRVFIKCEFMRVPESLKFAADFCLMPSRDEPFGYVDISSRGAGRC
jgi:alpha-1,3-glucan synthase